MHFGAAWRNRGIFFHHTLNKHWIVRRSLYQPKNVIFPLIATYYNNTSKFVIFSDQCLFRNSQRMSTARLAGKTIDDVLYPKIEPYKTGMLKVRQWRECQGIFQILDLEDYTNYKPNYIPVYLQFRSALCTQFTGKLVEMHRASQWLFYMEVLAVVAKPSIEGILILLHIISFN